MTVPFVSIIIPTYNDWTRLVLCLQALRQQHYPQEQFEVLIVNNNPADIKPEEVHLSSNCVLLTEARPGSYAARNAALQVARGSVIGFTDSDCIPAADWISNAVHYLQEHQTCSRVAGPVAVFSRDTPARISDKYDQIYAFPQQKYISKSGSSITANLFTYKHVFDQIGLFDGALLSNGDLEWGRKAQRANFEVHFVPGVAVQHPARSFAEMIKKEKRVGGGRGLVERKWNNKGANLWRIMNGFRPRLAEIKQVFRQAPHLRLVEKMQVILMRHYLLQVRALERLRVQLGKTPYRN